MISVVNDEIFMEAHKIDHNFSNVAAFSQAARMWALFHISLEMNIFLEIFNVEQGEISVKPQHFCIKKYISY